MMSLEAGASSYENLDTIEIKKQFNIIGDQLDILKTDSNIVSQQSVTRYNHVRKTYKGFLRENKTVLKELNYTRSQLYNLKHDIEKRKLDTEQAEAYINLEKLAVVAIKNAMDQYYARVVAQMEIYDKLYPEFERLTDSIKKYN